MFESKPTSETVSCPVRPSTSLNYFCETCGQSACLECKVASHRDHKVVTMVQKGNQVKKKLQSMLEDTTTELVMLFKKKEMLKKGEEDVETCILKATEQMRQRLTDVNNQLSQIYSKQKTIIEDVKCEQLRKFHEEANKVEKLHQQRADLCESIDHILKQSIGPSFLQQANNLLLKDSPQKVHVEEETDAWWKRTLYKRPDDPDEFLNYVENHILGHIRVGSASKRTSSFDEATDPGYSDRTSLPMLQRWPGQEVVRPGVTFLAM